MTEHNTGHNKKSTRGFGGPNQTPLERMADLTRRVVAVPKSGVIKPNPKKERKRRKDG